MAIDWTFITLLVVSNFIMLAGLGAFSGRPGRDPKSEAAPPPPATAAPPPCADAMAAMARASAAPPSRAEVAELIERALAAQREDMHMREGDMAYWGDTGRWVRIAIAEAEPVLLPVPAEGDLLQWLRDRRERLEEVRNEFRDERDDPDGFGLGTLGELQRDLDAIIAAFE